MKLYHSGDHCVQKTTGDERFASGFENCDKNERTEVKNSPKK